MLRETDNPIGNLAVSNETAAITQAGLLQRVPSYSAKSPYIIVGGTPITRAARELAKQRDLKELAIRFVDAGDSKRNWKPWDLPPQCIQEIIEYGPRLSETTSKTLEVFTSTELRVGSYTKSGLAVINDSLYRTLMMAKWGFEEGRHAIVTSESLIHSGKKNEVQVARMVAEAAADPWDPANHNGLDSQYGFVAFGAGQEWVTVKNYINGLRRMIRADYGLPERKTQEEIARKFEIGLCEPIVRIAGDESAHHILYVDILKILAKYFPSDAFGALLAVQKGFHMPMVEKIPESAEMAQILHGGVRKAGEFYVQGFNGITGQFGLDGKPALRRANEELKLTDVLEPAVLQVQPNGLITPADNFREIITALKAAA